MSRRTYGATAWQAAWSAPPAHGAWSQSGGASGPAGATTTTSSSPTAASTAASAISARGGGTSTAYMIDAGAGGHAMTLSRQALCAVYAVIGITALVTTWANVLGAVQQYGFWEGTVRFWQDTLVNESSRFITV